MDISIILPVYNEAETTGPLCDEMVKVMEKLNRPYEILFVDDGSQDGTPRELEGLAQKYSQVKVIQFTRNFGQTAAIQAGFEHAKGKVYIVLDGDGQNNPASIPDLLDKLEEGYDVVSGIRKNRQDNFLTRKLPSFFANRLISKITGLKLKDYGCSLKAYRAESIDNIHLYGEMHRFIPALVHMSGAKITEMEVQHRRRLKGKSKYGPFRIFKVLMDLMTIKFLGAFATKPNYLFGGGGTFFCFAAVLCGVEVLIEKFMFGTYAHKNPVLLLAVFLFILGVQFFMMGFLAELLIRTYHETQGKRTYLVKKLIHFEKSGTKIRSLVPGP